MASIVAVRRDFSTVPRSKVLANWYVPLSTTPPSESISPHPPEPTTVSIIPRPSTAAWLSHSPLASLGPWSSIRPVPINLMPFSDLSRTRFVFAPAKPGASFTTATTFRFARDGAVVMTIVACADSCPVESIHFAKYTPSSKAS
ncbi:hypothetical protein D3C81_1483960 [compost metagenome]